LIFCRSDLEDASLSSSLVDGAGADACGTRIPSILTCLLHLLSSHAPSCIAQSQKDHEPHYEQCCNTTVARTPSAAPTPQLVRLCDRQPRDVTTHGFCCTKSRHCSRLSALKGVRTSLRHDDISANMFTYLEGLPHAHRRLSSLSEMNTTTSRAPNPYVITVDE
jgi:hypothetical protein